MSNKQKDNIDDMLKNRDIPAPSNFLSARIANAAKSKPQNPFGQLLNGYMPRPALAMAACVMLIAGAVTLSPMLQNDTNSSTDYFASIYDDDYIFDAFDISAL